MVTFLNSIRVIDTIKIGVMFLFFWSVYLLLSINNIWYYIVAVASVVLFNNVGMDAGTHRYLSHRSFSLSTPIKFIVLFFATLTTVSFLKVQVGTHRLHHKYQDTDKDPQNSHVVSWYELYFHMFKTSKVNGAEQMVFYVRDLLKDKMVGFFDANYVSVILFYIMFLFAIDPYLVLFAYVIPAGYCLHTLGLVNCIGHRWGYKNSSDGGDSRNSILTAIITLGANGWHNNHHARPSEWSHGKKKWEIDPTSHIIRMIRNDR